jgi:hypothetical protein
MKRRTFIAIAGVGAGLCIVPPSLYFIAPGTQEYALKLLKKELFYLKITPGSAEKYVTDYFQAVKNDMMSNLKWKTTYYLGLNYEKSDRIRELIKYFLLSTDFFINKTDESKPVNYLGLYSPYKSPVPNPYSFLIYPAADIRNP